MKKELKIFLTAVMFYTRIPVPSWVDHSAGYLNKATRYFPMIGWIVGGLAGLVFWITQLVLPLSLSIILSMISSILITGAFHEDGFADVCDGFGGGWTKEKILKIMKDSVVGAYGVIGMILILFIKFYLLLESALITNATTMGVCMVAGHSLSRSAATSMIFSHDYVRENEDSKAKPVAKQLPIHQLFIAMALGITPLLVFLPPLLLLALIPVFFMKTYLGWYFKKWIGGYTGDCLGATQQVCEVIFYLSFFIVWKYS